MGLVFFAEAVMAIVALDEPPALVAVTITEYVPGVVSIPVITPVVASILRFAGSCGARYETTGPPTD